MHIARDIWGHSLEGLGEVDAAQPRYKLCLRETRQHGKDWAPVHPSVWFPILSPHFYL